MKAISRNYGLIHNLVEVAKWHKEHCHESCGVSLGMIREVCMQLEDRVWDDEHKEVMKEIESVDWS